MEIPFKWSRDEAIELCLEALATGGVYGVTANHDPDLLTTGTSFGQNSDSVFSMWRSWYLIEAHYGRWQADMPWRCGFLMVQPWRIKKPPKFGMLRKELHRYGFEFAEPGEAYPTSERRTVAVSGSSANIDRDDGKNLGRVLKISLPAAPPLTSSEPRRRTSPEVRAAVRDLATTAGAPADTWPAWFERLPPDDLLWHVRMLGSLHMDLPGSGRRAEWGVFGRWLLEQARPLWPADEWAWHWADFVVDHPGLAAPGEVARECLAALPMTPAQLAAIPADWRSRRPEDVRRARMTMALLRLAADDVPPPPDPTPALAEWQPFLHNPT